MAVQFLKDERLNDRTIVKVSAEEQEPLTGIRCPLCAWRPLASSRWSCDPIRSPEPFFNGCGTMWNTFLTRGCCPGCSHQWRWTSCLRCHQWSRHDDWYEESDSNT